MSGVHCAHFGVCGGCTLQNLDYPAQLKYKQKQLLNILKQHCRLEAVTVDPTISANPWGYRHRARFSVRQDKKGHIQIGFHKVLSSKHIVDIKVCPILPKNITDLISPLKRLIEGFIYPYGVVQLDVIVAKNVVAFVIRHIYPLYESDRKELEKFSSAHKVQIYLQSGGLHSIAPLEEGKEVSLRYALDEFDLSFEFHPAEFTQINPKVNAMMVSRVVALINPQEGERIGDLFCGIGNFSLPLARQKAHVVGMEVSHRQVQCADMNAKHNKLESNAEFRQYDLAHASQALAQELASFNKLLLDPSRSGASAVMASLKEEAPKQIVYVSCNPESLALDATVMIDEKGYQFKSVGLVDMFPQTDHIEAIAVFEKS